MTATAYNAYASPPNVQVTLGSGDSDTFQFDVNTGRMTQYKYTVGATPQSVVGNLTWNANGSLAQLAITDPFNSANAQTCGYSHDDLARIASANCGTAANQTFTFDPFGNIDKSGSPYSFLPSYNTATNRISLVGGSTPSYDANGNITNDFLNAYAWDANGRPVTVTPYGGSAVGMTYDALGRMVEQGRGSSYTQVVYDPTGNKLALLNGSTVAKVRVPLPSGGRAVYTGSGLAYYTHADWLGSERFFSTPSQTMYGDVAYAPFGETYASSGTPDVSFTGQNSDTVSGDYDFLFREYSIQGRWVSPDPAGMVAVDPTDPQSWNRYAYVRNSPLELIDPLGLWCVETKDGPVVCFPEFNNGPGTVIGGNGSKDRGKNGGGGLTVRGPAKPPVPPPQPCAVPNFLQALEIEGLTALADLTGYTLGTGLGASGGGGAIGIGAVAGASRQLVVSPGGKSALLTTFGTNALPFGVAVGSGPKLSGAGFVGGVQFTASNADSPDQLGGPSVNFTAGSASGLGGAVDLAVQSGGVLQGTLTIGGGMGGFGGALVPQQTTVDPICGSGPG